MFAYVTRWGTVEIVDSVFSENVGGESGEGGGLNVNGGSNSGGLETILAISGSSFANNGFLDGAGVGGGVSLFMVTGMTSITDSSFTGNTAGTGGGINVYTSWDATVALSRSTLSGNTAIRGGGLRFYTNYTNNQTSLEILNSTISGNVAEYGGGGEFRCDNSGRLAVAVGHATIVGNEAEYGAGMYLRKCDAAIDHSVIAGNNASADSADLGLSNGGSAVLDYCLVGNSAGTELVEAQSADAMGNLIGGSGGGIIEPQLGVLADNGGPTLTHLPLAASPLVDAGDPALEPDPGGDQRGLSRIEDSDAVAGARIDIGAVEVQP